MPGSRAPEASTRSWSAPGRSRTSTRPSTPARAPSPPRREREQRRFTRRTRGPTPPMPADPFAPLGVSVDIDAALSHLAEHGYARLGRVLGDAGLSALRERSDAVMLGEVRYPGLFFQLDTETGRYEDLTYKKGYQGPSLNYRKVEKIEKDPLFWAWINNPFFEQVARRLIAGPIAIYRAVLFNKAARGGTVLPFHQDGGSYWGLDRDPTLQIWTAIDDVPKLSGCVE